MISLNIEKTFGFISKEKVFAYEAEVKAAQEMLEKVARGNDCRLAGRRGGQQCHPGLYRKTGCQQDHQIGRAHV